MIFCLTEPTKNEVRHRFLVSLTRLAMRDGVASCCPARMLASLGEKRRLELLVALLHQQWPDFATWFDAGLPVLGHVVFNAWRGDRELLLKIAAWRARSSKASFDLRWLNNLVKIRGSCTGSCSGPAQHWHTVPYFCEPPLMRPSVSRNGSTIL
jgi:hypothetical protein